MQSEIDSEINVNDLLVELCSMQDSIKGGNGRPVVLLLGSTGSGKSTLLNYLMGAELEKFYDRFRTERIQVKPGKKEYSKIGHQNATAETSFAQILEKNPLPYVYCDCPGFFDTRGLKARIMSGVSNQTVIQNSLKVQSVLLLLSFSGITEERAAGLRKQLVVLRTMLPQLKESMKSVFIVITKSSKGTTSDDIIGMLNQILKEVKELLVQMPDNKEHLESKETLELILSNPGSIIVADPLDDILEPQGASMRMFPVVNGAASTAPKPGRTREEIKDKVGKAPGIQPKSFRFAEHADTLNSLYALLNSIRQRGEKHVDAVKKYEARIKELTAQRSAVEADLKKKRTEYQARINATTLDAQLNNYLAQSQSMITKESSDINGLEANRITHMQAVERMNKEKTTLIERKTQLMSELNKKYPHTLAINRGVIFEPFKPVFQLEAQVVEINTSIAKENDLAKSCSSQLEVKRQRVSQLQADMQKTTRISVDTRNRLRSELEAALASEEKKSKTSLDSIANSIRLLDTQHTDALGYFQEMERTQHLVRLAKIVKAMPNVFDAQNEIKKFIDNYLGCLSAVKLLMDNASRPVRK